MSKKKTFNENRAEGIAKLFMKGNSRYSIIPDPKFKFDFLAVNKENEKKYAIEVKSINIPKSKIFQNFSSIRNEISHYDIPVVMMYIDGQNERGYFEIINKTLPNQLTPLTGETLSHQLKIIEK
jgi:hypothetical protein